MANEIVAYSNGLAETCDADRFGRPGLLRVADIAAIAGLRMHNGFVKDSA